MKELINDHPKCSTFVPSNEHYPRDRTDYQYKQVRVDISLFKGGDDPKDFLNWESPERVRWWECSALHIESVHEGAKR